MDNDVLSALIQGNLNATEYQVVLFVIRKTWGWNKKEDWISISKFMEITGKSRQSIITSTNSLVKKNILVKKTIPGIKTTYFFNKDFSSWVVQKTVPVKKTVPVQKTVPTSTENCTGVVQKTVLTKETITKETIQKKYSSIKNLTENDFEEIANDYKVPVSFVLSKLEDMQNWMEAKGKRYKNYKSALRNWVKTDAIKRIDNAKQSNNKRSIDLSNL